MRKDHSDCSGCSLCLLACPVWRQTHDIRLTPHGRAKALQHGASARDIAASVAQCTLCGACEPACPEGIPLISMMLGLREQAPLTATTFAEPAATPAGATILLTNKALQGERLERAARLLDAAVVDSSDIALALETGTPIPPGHLARFLRNLRGAKRVVVAEGLLLRRLREWLPGMQVASLGAVLMNLAPVRSQIRRTDLYVIEPRAFHGDHANLVGHYDALRLSTGCMTNLDLQRLAIPTTASAAQRAFNLPAIDASAQARWILEGRDYERVVVEDAADCAVFAAVTDRPVVHVADLA
ncbi:MAG: 4Fe-4S dicluster domain-containing protein [Betaproteobacteria bacterium]|nr:4Fe-4S dicluster domain-containing protein [Betaproteobacteria bacterium]